MSISQEYSFPAGWLRDSTPCVYLVEGEPKNLTKEKVQEVVIACATMLDLGVAFEEVRSTEAEWLVHMRWEHAKTHFEQVSSSAGICVYVQTDDA